MTKMILIKYGELSTKGDNRHIFISVLKENIEKVVQTEIDILKKHDRIYIKTENIADTIADLKKVFGIHKMALCYQVANEEEAIKKTVLKLISEASGKTFKIVTKRANKNFPTNSQMMNHLIGGHVLKNSNLQVDIKKPDIKITIEIRDEFTYVYHEEIKGLGGFPVGVGGRGLLLLSGGIDSPVAGYLTMKRGIALDCLYFESPPHTSERAKNKVIRLAQVLKKYDCDLNLYVVNFTAIQEKIYQTLPLNYNITIMRRFMVAIAEEFALTKAAKILITGESIGQVASQTLESLAVIDEKTKMPIIRPLVCYDKSEIITLAKNIGTYDISIEPYQDCCTVFIAKHPVIRPSLKTVYEYEAKLPFTELKKAALEQIKKENIKKEKHELL